MSEDLKEQVRRRYAEVATAVQGTGEDGEASCCDSSCCGPDPQALEVNLTEGSYSAEEKQELSQAAVEASLGCGNPVALATLSPGEAVLDLGSGGGIDVLLSARRVSLGGKAYGVDMTDEMLALARENQRKAGVENVEWLRGHIEDVPLPAESVDVVISNCVINLSADKLAVVREAARVLRPGGRLAVSDVIADEDMDDATRADMQQFTGCIAGALTRGDFERALHGAGLVDVEIAETHRVHQRAASAIIRARKPSPGCCEPAAQASCCEPEAKSECCGSATTAGGGCGCQTV